MENQDGWIRGPCYVEDSCKEGKPLNKMSLQQRNKALERLTNPSVYIVCRHEVHYWLLCSSKIGILLPMWGHTRRDMKRKRKASDVAQRSICSAAYCASCVSPAVFVIVQRIVCLT